MANPTYQDLIQDLIDGIGPNGENITYNNYYNNDTYSNLLKTKTELWKQIIDFLANTKNTPISSMPSNSLFGYIGQKIDGIDDLPASEVWNESVQAALEQYFQTFGDNATITLKDGVEIKLSDIKNANAGYSFLQSPWVMPNLNIDNETYDEVRNGDEIKSVLKNSSELQFTRKSGANAWLRLLMPKYLRSVEVEDLNRNFWVLGQTTSAICAFLFGDNGLPQLLEDLLKEIIGLWENVLYLWAALALLTTEDEFNIHYEVVTLPNSTYEPYRKFDYFWNDTGDAIPYLGYDSDTGAWRHRDEIKKAIMERLSYLKEMYPKSHLIILPEIRENNYKHNYYSRAEYPGIYVYNRKTNVEHWHWFEIYHDGANWLRDYFIGQKNDKDGTTIRGVNEGETADAYHKYLEASVLQPGVGYVENYLMYYYGYNANAFIENEDDNRNPKNGDNYGNHHGWLILDIERDCKKSSDPIWSGRTLYLYHTFAMLEKETEYYWGFPLINAFKKSDPYYGMLRTVIHMNESEENTVGNILIDDGAAYTYNKGVPSRLFNFEWRTRTEDLLNNDDPIALFGHNTFQKYRNYPELNTGEDGYYHYYGVTQEDEDGNVTFHHADPVPTYNFGEVDPEIFSKFAGYDLAQSSLNIKIGDCVVNSQDKIDVVQNRGVKEENPNFFVDKPAVRRSLRHDWVYSNNYEVPELTPLDFKDVTDFWRSGHENFGKGYYMGEMVTCQNLLVPQEMAVNAVAYWGEPGVELTTDDFNGITED